MIFSLISYRKLEESDWLDAFCVTPLQFDANWASFCFKLFADIIIECYGIILFYDFSVNVILEQKFNSIRSRTTLIILVSK